MLRGCSRDGGTPRIERAVFEGFVVGTVEDIVGGGDTSDDQTRGTTGGVEVDIIACSEDSKHAQLDWLGASQERPNACCDRFVVSECDGGDCVALSDVFTGATPDFISVCHPVSVVDSCGVGGIHAPEFVGWSGFRIFIPW